MEELMLLKEIEKGVAKDELQSALFEASSAVPYSYLMVYLGVDQKNRQKLLEITVQKQIMNPTEDSNLFRIQFQTKLPFQIGEFSVSQVSNLISLINRFLDLPGFEMSELDNAIFYRYVLFTTGEGVNADLLSSLIGNIMLILELYSRPIESVAIGEMSYNELLEQTLKITKKLKKDASVL